MSPAKIVHRSPLDFLARKPSGSRQNLKQAQTTPELHTDPPSPNSSNYPESPILHTEFRTSVATTTDSNATSANLPRQSYPEAPPSPSLYSVDSNGILEQSPYPKPGPSSLQRSPSTSAQVAARYSSNFSRPTPPRTPEGERAKREVLNRVRMARSTENVSSNGGFLSPSPSSFSYQQQNVIYSANRTSANPSPHSSATNFAYSLVQSATPSSSIEKEQQSDPFSRNLSPNHLTLPLQSSHSTPMSASMREQWASALALPSSSVISPENQSLTPSEAVYDNYSFYEFPSSTPTSRSPSPRVVSPFRSPSRSPVPQKSPISPAKILEPKTAEDYLTMGIDTHLIDSAEALSESAKFFELSATLDGGTPFGMLMWGLCLRHGWGIPKDEKQGFVWLRRACEIAVGDLEGLQLPDSEGNQSSGKLPAIVQGTLKEVKAELVLAIYEVGQCFFQGWGVPRDRTMGFNYFLLASRLGDVDAQQELGYCYSNGKGCKKDRKEAAKWYRAAAAQGASTVGLAWIYKDKFQ